MWTPVFADNADAVGLKDLLLCCCFSVFYGEGHYRMLGAGSIAVDKMGAFLKLDSLAEEGDSSTHQHHAISFQRE